MCSEYRRISSIEIDLRSALHAVFSTFGRVLDIVTADAYQLRGQAWVIFDSPEGASRALSGVQGFTFFGKPMVRQKHLSLSTIMGLFVRILRMHTKLQMS